MSKIVAPSELQRTLDEATRLHFAHFNRLDWLPPWTSTKPTLPDNISAPPEPPKTGPTPLNCIIPLFDRIKTLKGKYPDMLKHVDAKREVEDPDNPETGSKLHKAPHPEADCSHVDPGIYLENEDPNIPSKPNKDAFRRVFRAVTDVEDMAKVDGEIYKAFGDVIRPMNRAKDLLGADPKGMQRLKLIFEWTLCQVTTLYGEINAALANSNPTQGKDDYTAARTNYIALLHDLDDSEPETKGQPKAGVRGYGRVIKWAYILPLIHDGKIKGAKVIAKWNPHVSSSGIPVAHS